MPVHLVDDDSAEFNANGLEEFGSAFELLEPSTDIHEPQVDVASEHTVLSGVDSPSEAPVVEAQSEPEFKKLKYDIVDKAADDVSLPVTTTAVSSLVPSHVVRDAIRLTDTGQFKFPWEKGRMKRFFDGAPVLENFKHRLQPSTNNFVQVHVGVGSNASIDSTLDVQSVPKDDALFLKSVRVFKGNSYAEERESKRCEAINLWWDLLCVDLNASDPGIAAQNEAPESEWNEYGKNVLGACFAVRSPNTLLKRYYAFRTYSEWCANNGGFDWLPLHEQHVWQYLLHLRDTKGPASRATSLIEAVRFGWFVLRLVGSEEVLKSLRLKGLASQMYLQKRPWRPADTLSITEVVRLHKALHDVDRCLTDRVFCGHLLHLLYARSRWSDMLSMRNVYIDEQGAFIEAETAIHKGARGYDTKSKLLPVVAPAEGVCYDAWAKTYFDLRHDAGLSEPGDTPGPMLPAPDRAGAGLWTERYLTSQEANSFLKLFFHGSELGGRPKRLTTHSMKATALSWCAKGGLSGEDRAILARHQTAVQGPTALYSRDVISAALRKFQTVLHNIRIETFHPDANRSGMITPRPAVPSTPTFAFKPQEQDPPDSRETELNCGQTQLDGESNNEVLPTTDIAVKQEPMEWPTHLAASLDAFEDEAIVISDDEVQMRDWLESWNSSSSDDSASSTDESSSNDVEDWNLVDGDQVEPDHAASDALYINPSSLVVHQARLNTKFRCGRKITSTYIRIREANGLKCGKCFPWLVAGKNVSSLAGWAIMYGMWDQFVWSAINGLPTFMSCLIYEYILCMTCVFVV